MSEKITRVGRFEITLYESGSVLIFEDFGPYKDYKFHDGTMIEIPAEHRQSVALALVGGVTDALTRSVNGALLDVLEGRITGSGPSIHILNAIFGVTEP